jgi:predicted thioredoxin/glutaredoxin
MELKVFTLPTCSVCSIAKIITSEVAQEYGVSCRVVDMATKEGLNEGSAHHIMSTPSIALDDDVFVSGHLVSKEKLEEEVKKRLERWKGRASSE